MGYIHHIKGDFFTALTEYHKSLSLQPDSTLVTELLNMCLADAYKAGIL